jgi:hypothetical protein
MENISRGPTFGDFVTILTEGSMKDNSVARLQSTRVQTRCASFAHIFFRTKRNAKYSHFPPSRTITNRFYLINSLKFFSSSKQNAKSSNIPCLERKRIQTAYPSTDYPFPPLLNVMYCVRVFLRTVKIFLAQN